MANATASVSILVAVTSSPGFHYEISGREPQGTARNPSSRGRYKRSPVLRKIGKPDVRILAVSSVISSCSIT
jgi:hypothetical protein